MDEKENFIKLKNAQTEFHAKIRSKHKFVGNSLPFSEVPSNHP